MRSKLQIKLWIKIEREFEIKLFIKIKIKRDIY